MMPVLHTWVSEDIKAIVDWELAHGNALDRVHYPEGYPDGPPAVALKQPVRRRDDTVAASCQWWEFRDTHYGESEWYAGYESSVTRHRVGGPLP